MRKHFFQFGVRQLALLFVVLGVLLAIATPGLQRAYVARRLEQDARRLAETQANLAAAVRNDDVALAQRALAEGANPNQVADQHSLLYRCLQHGQLAMMELLLEGGADVERIETLRSLVSQGPLLYAAIGSNQPSEVRLEMIRRLVEHGADVHAEHGGRSAMDMAIYRYDPQVADLLKELGLPYGPREMAAFNRLDELRRVVEENPEVLAARYPPVYAARPGQGSTLLGLALERGYREMAEFLIESGAPLDTVEGRGQTPLHLATRGGDPQLIRLLIDQGLNVHAKDDYQDTPLTDSAWRAPPAAIAALLQAGADVNERGMKGRTALQIAVRAVPRHSEEAETLAERLEVIRLLLAAGADPSIPDANGETALDWALENHPEIAKLLAEAGTPCDQ